MTENKEFDSVEMMRELRHDVDKQLEGKTYEEQRRYLDEHVTLHRKAEEAGKRRRASRQHTNGRNN